MSASSLLVRHGWDDGWAAALTELDPSARPGRVLRGSGVARHEASCFQPRTLDRLYEIGKVAPGLPDECWEWQGDVSGGYGRFTSLGKTRRAHREALQIALGRTLAKDEHALHSCDNPPCVNVSHLRPGSQGDNNKDAWERGRRAHEAPDKCVHGHAYTPENTWPEHTHCNTSAGGRLGAAITNARRRVTRPTMVAERDRGIRGW